MDFDSLSIERIIYPFRRDANISNSVSMAFYIFKYWIY